jgi:hypothetical protein
MASNRLVRRNAASPAVPGVDLPTLDLAEVEHDTTEALVARGAAYVREYAAVEHKPTILLYNIATVLVALRGQHTTEDGSPDWRGRSGPYRVDAAEIYRLAGVTEETAGRVGSAVRWHVGNILRRRLTAEELQAYDLQQDSPLDRLQDRRQRTTAIVAAARAEVEAAEASQSTGTAVVKATADHVRLGKAVTNILDQLSVDVITDGMTDGQRAKLDEELAAAQEHIRKLRRHTRKRRSAG